MFGISHLLRFLQHRYLCRSVQLRIDTDLHSCADAVVFLSLGLISLGGGLIGSSLLCSATKQRVMNAKLTETHVRAAQLLGAGIYALIMVRQNRNIESRGLVLTVFVVSEQFLHELFGLSSLVLLGGLGVATIFFSVLSVTLWPKGLSRSASFSNLQQNTLETSSGEEDLAESSHTEEEHVVSIDGSISSKQRTSLDQIITRFSPSYGSVSEGMNNLFNESSQYYARYADLTVWQQLFKVEFIFFAIYSAVVNYWSVFFLASVHYRLSEAGAISSEGEYIPLLVWLIAASAVLVPLAKLVVGRIGLVGSVFLLHVTFSLWSLCLILRQFQLVLVSFVLLGATRGLLSGLEINYVRRLFGLANSQHLLSIAHFLTAIVCGGVYPMLMYSVGVVRQGTASGFFVPTMVQDASAAVLLSLPILLWIRNVDKASTES